ncbi:hypothetical protein EON66_07235 [archaeon]|nr:MAG: hypothetical protein EON66_07235 [archaeon]
MAITDYMLDNPSPDLVGASPAPHTNVHIPRKIRGRLSDPYYIVRDDAHKQLAFKVRGTETLQRKNVVCRCIAGCAAHATTFVHA